MCSLIVYKVHEQEIAQNYGVGTSDKGLRINAFYDELVRVLGKPTFPIPNEDETVYRSWVCRWNSNTYEIYDFQTYSEEYTLNFNRSWNVGTNQDNYTLDFIEFIENAIKTNLILD